MNDFALLPLFVLSPHVDDAVLSCGGRLWDGLRLGRAQRVITLTTGIPPYDALPPFARELHAIWGNPPRLVELRRAEDRAALARLAVDDAVHLDVFDAIYRLGPDGEGLYDSRASLFGPLSLNEPLQPSALAQALAPWLPPPGEGEVLAPLASGNHVDHQLVHAAARALAAQGHRVAYYEDLPYSAKAGLLDRALEDKAGWTPATWPLDEAALAAKVSAMSYYRSQIGDLFGDDLAMSNSLRAYAAKVAPQGSPYGERVWRENEATR